MPGEVFPRGGEAARRMIFPTKDRVYLGVVQTEVSTERRISSLIFIPILGILKDVNSRTASYFCVIALAAYAGCASSSSGDQTAAAGRETSPAPARAPGAGAPNAMKQNATAVGARVDSLLIIDALSYRLALTIDSAAPVGGIDSFADSGQQISAVPGYVTDETGRPDTLNERNLRLMKGRAFKPGDHFRGIISLRSSGGWVLTDLPDH